MDTARLANDYLVGRAGSYQEFSYRDYNIDSTETLHRLLGGTAAEVFGESLFFPGGLDEKDLRLMDEWRDRLVNRRMIWWVPLENLAAWLEQWPHLRQFLRVLVLEEDLRKYLDQEQLHADLEDIETLSSDPADAERFLERLHHVLRYLDQGGRHERPSSRKNNVTN